MLVVLEFSLQFEEFDSSQFCFNFEFVARNFVDFDPKFAVIELDSESEVPDFGKIDFADSDPMFVVFEFVNFVPKFESVVQN